MSGRVDGTSFVLVVILASSTVVFASFYNISKVQALDILGTPGNDILVGTPDSDRIAGLGGNDNISGQGSDDAVSGGDGNDSLFGMNGDDQN